MGRRRRQVPRDPDERRGEHEREPRPPRDAPRLASESVRPPRCAPARDAADAGRRGPRRRRSTCCAAARQIAQGEPHARAPERDSSDRAGTPQTPRRGRSSSEHDRGQPGRERVRGPRLADRGPEERDRAREQDAEEPQREEAMAPRHDPRDGRGEVVRVRSLEGETCGYGRLGKRRRACGRRLRRLRATVRGGSGPLGSITKESLPSAGGVPWCAICSANATWFASLPGRSSGCRCTRRRSTRG